MSEIVFVVEEGVEGGFIARAVGEPIFTEGDTMADLRLNIRDAVLCHFQENDRPQRIRLQFLKEEVITL